MSDSSGSILQVKPKTTALSNVNLLIVTDNKTDIEAITKPLYSVEIDLYYEVVSVDKLGANLPQQKYSAILYDYFPASSYTIDNCLTEQLQLWCHLYPQTPFILITDALGDELAVELIQSGVSGYILRQKLYKLPDVLENTLFNFVSKQTIVAQQLDLIKQQDERIRQLEVEKQNLIAQEKVKQEQLSHLNHELRSPISSILGFAGMLKEQYYGSLNPKQLQYVSALLTVGKHLLDLVNNYLDLAKIDANKQTLDLERLAVSEICQASLFIVADQAKQKGLELIYEQGDNIFFCTADSIRLKQILVNLLSNAIKFTNEGSVILKVQLKQDLLYFAVIDTGIGISPENIVKLFKPFPQITNHYESTGLGLALSQKLAQLHGGDITVTSEPGKGSCFTLCIPQYQ